MATKIQQSLQTAVFMDAENNADLHVPDLMQHLSGFDIVEQRAYADWRNRRLDRLSKQLERAGFEMHHTWSGPRCGVHKDKADDQMQRDILRVLSRRPDVEAIVIVSGDSFFTRVANQLQQQDKRVTVVADPLRASKKLRSVANEYLPIGELGRWIRSLDQLERTSRYLTFRFAIQRLKDRPRGLAELIRQGWVIQEEVWRPQRGTRPEIRLNRKDSVVQAVLNASP